MFNLALLHDLIVLTIFLNIALYTAKLYLKQRSLNNI